MYDGCDLLRLETENPSDAETPADTTRFVSVLCGAGRLGTRLAATLPPDGRWLVRLIGASGRFV